MSNKYDFKKEWPKIRKQLMALSQEAMVYAKKGEKELMKLSREGKRQIDTTALGLKKEHLFHLIGKEYINTGCPGEQSTAMKKLMTDFQKLEKDMATLKKKKNTTVARKKSASSAKKTTKRSARKTSASAAK